MVEFILDVTYAAVRVKLPFWQMHNLRISCTHYEHDVKCSQVVSTNANLEGNVRRL